MKIYIVEERYRDDRDIAGASTEIKDALSVAAAVVAGETIAIIEVWAEPRTYIGKYKLWYEGGVLTGGKISRGSAGDPTLEEYLKHMGWWTE